MSQKLTKLQQIRNHFRQQYIQQQMEPEPEPEVEESVPHTSGVNLNEVTKRRLETSGRFAVIMNKDGKPDDLTLKFGQHKGKRISDMARSADGRGYLQWMLREGFPQEAKDIVKFWLERAQDQT